MSKLTNSMVGLGVCGAATGVGIGIIVGVPLASLYTEYTYGVVTHYFGASPFITMANWGALSATENAMISVCILSVPVLLCGLGMGFAYAISQKEEIKIQ